MRQAVIIAAGEGQRLRPFTLTRPKVMLSIAGKPLLQYVIEALARNGIRNIIIVAGYRREQVFDYFGAGDKFGVDIEYATQDRQLGTAHALMQAKNSVDKEFLVIHGDKLIEPETIARFVSVKPNTILIKRVENPARYGVVTIENGKVTEIVEKPKEATSNIISAGIFAFNTKVFDYMKGVLNIPDVITSMIEDGCSIGARETGGTWLDIVYPWDILSLNEAVLRRVPSSLGGTIEKGVTISGQVTIGKDTIIRSNSYIVGPAVIGENCDIGPNVCIRPATSIGGNVVISPFTDIRNSVIGDDVNIGSSSIIQNSVIDNGCIISGHFVACTGPAEVKINDEYHSVGMGAMLGLGCNLGNSVVAQPGVIVGNYSQVQAMKLINGKLPDRSVVF